MQQPQLDEAEARELRRESQFSRWSSIVLMVAILMLAGLGRALTAMRFAIRGHEVQVPKVTGKTKDEAEQILRGVGLKLKVSISLLSSKFAEGKVLDQIPPSETRHKTERNVRILLFL